MGPVAVEGLTLAVPSLLPPSMWICAHATVS